MPDFETKNGKQEGMVRDADFGKDFDIVAALNKEIEEAEEEAERVEKYARDMALKRAESGGVVEGGLAAGMAQRKKQEGGSEEEISQRQRQTGRKKATGEEGSLGRLSEKEWNEDLVRRYFAPSRYITDRFEEAQSVYKFANDIFEGLRDSERLTDKQTLALEAAVRLEAKAEAAWSEAEELEELERTEAVEISRKAWMEEALHREQKDLISSLLIGEKGEDLKGGRRLRSIFKEAWYGDDPEGVVKSAVDERKISQRDAGELKRALRLSAVLEEAWYGDDPEEVVRRALDGSKISKPEANELRSILVVRTVPAMTVEEMITLKPKIEQRSKAREKTNKVRRNILAYVYNLEQAMRTPAREEETVEEIKERSKEIWVLRGAAKSADPEKAVREAFAKRLTLEDYDAIEERAAVLRKRAPVEKEGGADVAGLLEALAIKAIDEDMPAEEFDRLKEEIIRGGGAGKNRGAARPEVEVQGRRIENNDARVLYGFIQSKDLPPQDSGRLLGIVEGLGDAQDFTASLKRSEILKRDFDVIRKLQKEIEGMKTEKKEVSGS